MSQPMKQPMKHQGEGRSCGACTACCDGWLKIEVRGHEVRPGKPCPFSIDHRCSIYAERPQHPCREFICGWLVPSSPLPDWMRPDMSNTIMLAANFAGRCARRRRRSAEEKGARLADALLRRTAPLPCLPDRRGLVCIRSARFSVGDCPARQARREALERLRRPFAVPTHVRGRSACRSWVLCFDIRRGLVVVVGHRQAKTSRRENGK